jgi:hypothetical protein
VGEKAGAMKQVQSLLVLALVNAFALSLVNAPGTYDVPIWMGWVDLLNRVGIVAGFQQIYDYPPLSNTILFFVGKLALFLQVPNITAHKLMLYAFLLATTLVFWMWSRDAFIAAMIELVLIVSSTSLGYQDMYFAPQLVLALWALQSNRWLLSTLLLASSFLVKWQPIMLLPFIVIYIANINTLSDWKRADYRRLGLAVFLPLAIIFVAMFAIFGSAFGYVMFRATSQDYLSGGGLNFNWIVTYLLHVFDPSAFGGLAAGEATIIQTTDLRIVLLPKLMFLALYAIALGAFLKSRKTFENLILFALAGYLAYFMFNTGVHENHLFLAVILVGVLLCVNRNHWTTFVTWTLAHNINLVLFFNLDGSEFSFRRVVGVDMALLLAVIYLFLFAQFYITTLRDPHTVQPEETHAIETHLPP